MQITVKELRNGTMIFRNQMIMQVLEYQFMNDVCRIKVMNYANKEKQVLDIHMTEMLEVVVPKVMYVELSYYEDGKYHFFDPDTYQIIEVEERVIEDSKWMIGEQTCTLSTYNGNVYHVHHARYVKAKVVNIEAGLNPIAVLENGVKVDVNSSVSVGDVIKVDTLALCYCQ